MKIEYFSDTHLVVVNLAFTLSIRAYSLPSRISAFGNTLTWMLAFSGGKKQTT